MAKYDNGYCKMNNKWLRLVILSLTGLTGLIAFATGVEHYYGKIDLGNGHFYSSTGKIVKKKGQVNKSARFFDEKGQLILTETVTYAESDYKLQKLLVDENRYGREHEITRKGDAYVIRYREKTGERYSERTVGDHQLTLHGSYLPIYLSENLNLIGESGLVCRLIIVPQKMEIEMIFRNNGIKTIGGHECYEITMDAANILLRTIVKTHYFYYETAKPHHLYLYIGTIAPTEPNGDALWGTISFTYD
jgi:hypothetical protein